MKRCNWNDFYKKNRDKEKAFEDMCRILFLRERRKSINTYQYNYNEAGLEFQPVYDEAKKKWYGAQCKNFSTKSATKKYDEIYKSLIKAKKCFEGKLDVVYIYTNDNLHPILTQEELDEKIKKSKKSSRTKINLMNNKKDPEIIYKLPDNILDEIHSVENLDLYQIYFCDTKEFEFINDILSIEDTTFFRSKEFLNLKFNNGNTVNSLYYSFSNHEIGLIAGSAGTGKTIAMKKIFSDIADEFKKFYFNSGEIDNEDVKIPVFIRLRECVNGDLESLLRERLNDYRLNNTDKGYSYFYLLDGLDEVPYYDMDKVISTIVGLNKKETTKGVLISSRIESSNLTYLRQQFSTINEYIFDKLTYSDIELYFNNKENIEKIDRLTSIKESNIINEIDDIFSVKLLWDNIFQLSGFTSKIEIIELAIKHWIKGYKKLKELPVLEPKVEKLQFICEEIALEMQKKMMLSIPLDKVQKIIKEKFNIQSALDINIIVDSLTDLFFEGKNSSNYKANLSFRHRRFQEYFLFLRVEKEFFRKPYILRELKLFANREFVVNIFLRTSLKRAKHNNDIFRCLALRLLEYYLGGDYLKKYKDDLIGVNLFRGGKPSYSYSTSFLYLLSMYDSKEIEVILRDPNIDLYDAINEDNYGELIEIYHRINKQDISDIVKKIYKLNNIKVNHRNVKNYVYFLYVIKKVDIELLNNRFIKSSINYEDVKQMDYIASDYIFESSFIKICLEFEVENLISLLPKVDKDKLEVICYYLLKHENIKLLLGENPELIEALIKRVEEINEEYLVNTLAVYNFISKRKKNVQKLEDAFKKVNIRNYNTWSTNIELHIMLAYLDNNKNSYAIEEFKLGVDLIGTVYDNDNNKNLILEKWLEKIKPFNYIYNEWLIYSNSSILGKLIAKLDFDILSLRKFIREIINYPTVIYLHTLLFNIFIHNNELFNTLVSKALLDKVIVNAINEERGYYQDISESIFQLAVMYDAVSKDKKFELMITAINNDVVRPGFRGEDLYTLVMPECLYMAYQNYWYDNNEMKEKCSRLYELIQVTNMHTDYAASLEFFKWIVENCVIDNIDLLRLLSDESSIDLSDKADDFEYDFSLINSNNIRSYYEGKVEEVPYCSVKFWRNLISIGYKIDNNLDALFDVLRNSRYPSHFGYEEFKYNYIPISILLENDKTREKTIEFIIKQGGSLGIYNMIRVFCINGNMQEGVKYIEFLFNFAELLSKIERISANDSFNNLESNDRSIYAYSSDDWIVDNEKCEAYLIQNLKIKIKWDEFDECEEFYEDWAVSVFDRKAYICDYILYNEERIQKRFSLVWVDNYMVGLPLPEGRTKVVNRENYLLSRVFTKKDVLDMYMKITGLIVK